MTSAERFLNLLAEKDLLPEKVLQTLRQRVPQADKPVSATAIARQLIKAGHLTPALAKRLLAAASPSPEDTDQPHLVPVEPEGEQPPARPDDEKDTLDLPNLEEEEDELGLAPLEEDAKSAKKGSAKKPPEDDLDLAPLDDVDAKAAPKKQSKPAPPEPTGEEPAGLVVVGDAETDAPKSPPAGKRPTAKKPQTPARKPKQPAKKVSKEKPKEEAPAPTGGSLLDEELAPLDDSLAAGPLDDLMAMSGSPLDSAAGAPLGGPAPKKKGLFAAFGRKRSTGRRSKTWDSPLMLAGGGTLLVLLILLVVFVVRVNVETGDKMLEPANEDYRSGSYTQAIFKYDAFLEKFPNHPGASLARVRRGLAQIRQATEGANDWPKALETAKSVVGQISVETDFKEAHAELASLLPAIAQGLADEARKTPDATIVEQARETLALVDRHVPKSLQNRVTLDTIDASLGLTARELARDAELAKAIAAIEKAVEDGNPAEAYKTRNSLLKQYSGLIGDAGLAAAIRKVSQSQADTVKEVAKALSAQTAERPSPITATVALARQNVAETVPGVENRVVFALSSRTLFALDAARGALLWQRPLGSPSDGRTPPALPVPLSPSSPTDVLLCDTLRNEVLRVEAATGQLRWRLLLNQPLQSQPVVAGQQALVVAGDDQASRLVRIDLETGASSGYVQLAQPVRVAPCVDLRRDNVYLVAEHSNLYVLSLADGHCKEVLYLGHRLNSITAAPVAVSRFLLLADNEKNCLLRVLTVEAEDEGPAIRQLQQIELGGRVDTPPLAADRRLAVVTDRGEIDVFEISGTNAEEPLNRVGQRIGEGRRELVRFPLLAQGQFWVAGDQLSKYDIQAARGRLMPKAIQSADEGAVFVQPLVAIGQTLYQARYEPEVPGLRVSAVEMSEGKRLWETRLATPPAAEPIVDAGTATCVTAAGALFTVDDAAIKASAPLNRPAATVDPALLKQGLTTVASLGAGRLAMAGGPGAERVFVFDPEQAEAPLAPRPLPGPLTCPPVVYSGGILAPCSPGQVFLLDPATGQMQVEPFQPTLRPGDPLSWRRPALLESDEFLIADGRTRLYRVGVKQQPKPFLAAVASVELTESIVSPLAVIGQSAIAIDQSGMLLAFALPDLKQTDVVHLDGQCVWGPQTVGPHALLATDRDELLLVGPDGQLAGRAPLAYGPLAGAPLDYEDGYLLASASGTVWQVRSPSGDAPAAEVAKIQLDRPLASGPVLYDGKLLVAGHDGCVYLVPVPKPEKKTDR